MTLLDDAPVPPAAPPTLASGAGDAPQPQPPDC